MNFLSNLQSLVRKAQQIALFALFLIFQTVVVSAQEGSEVTYYRIQNRWQPNSYLYDTGSGQVNYGTNPTTHDYQWIKADAGDGYFTLKNRATGFYMHVENGDNPALQSSALDPTWASSHWAINDATDGWKIIQNRWRSLSLIHMEDLAVYAQHLNGQTNWYSAMWNIEPLTVLPLTLNSFSGRAEFGGNVLAWATEFNKAVFEIERKSVDANAFEKIGELVSKNSNGISTYRYTDNGASGKLNYYRLKTVDLDGEISYSRAIAVSSLNSQSVKIYPNPFSEGITIDAPNLEQGKIVISDLSGRVIQELKSKDAITEVNLSNLDKGLFIITFYKNGKAVHTHRVLKN